MKNRCRKLHSWAAMNLPEAIEVWPVDRPQPYSRNARTHDAAQVEKIAASMLEFGFTNPILVDANDTIIAGHGRVLAARKLGMEEVPCIELAGLTDTQRRAYIIADNKLALNGGWSEDMLKIELEELGELGFDLDLIGFTDEEILALGEGELADDDEPGEPAEPKGNLSDRFMIPPCTVLNAREGWWQDRKRGWLALGIKSELGRGDALVGYSEACKKGYAKSYNMHGRANEIRIQLRTALSQTGRKPVPYPRLRRYRQRPAPGAQAKAQVGVFPVHEKSLLIEQAHLAQRIST